MKAPLSLEHSALYSQSSTLLGTAEEADNLLRKLENDIALYGYQFPIVKSPDLRLASLDGAGYGVFFRIISNEKIQLLWVLVHQAQAAA